MCREAMAMAHEIHVLVVDHEPDALFFTAKNLELCHYTVTYVELASAGISMLLSGKAKFDLVIANINSPDLHGFKLLQHAVAMGLPVVLMSCVDENGYEAMRALENGAFLLIKKPVSLEIAKCLWQHVARDKIINRERRNHHQMFVGDPNLEREMMNGIGIGIGIGSSSKKKKQYMMMMRKQNDDHKEEECSSESGGGKKQVRRKMCTEWTQDLHAKFLHAVELLGEGRCFPKEILELMNVPGLTRMQVASHLQKCRNHNWRSPQHRKPNQRDHHTQLHSRLIRRFGSKPCITKTINCLLNPPHFDNHDQHSAHMETRTHWSSDTSNFETTAQTTPTP